MRLVRSSPRADPADQAVPGNQAVRGAQADPDRLPRRHNQFHPRQDRQTRPTRQHQQRAGEQLVRVASTPFQKATTAGNSPTPDKAATAGESPHARADYDKYSASETSSHQ